MPIYTKYTLFRQQTHICKERRIGCSSSEALILLLLPNAAYYYRFGQHVKLPVVLPKSQNENNKKLYSNCEDLISTYNINM